MNAISTEIFRAYDIRGIVDQTLTHETVYKIGMAIGTMVLRSGESSIIIARDGRLSGPSLSQQLAQGIQATGCDVVDIQQVPTPVLYYAAKTMEPNSAIMLTGSHNPTNYNGLKIIINDKAIHGNQIQTLLTMIQKNDFLEGSGNYSTLDIQDNYLKAVITRITLTAKKPLKIVVDCGNGVAGDLAPKLYEQLGCTVIPLYCEIDGHFPNHHPDPGNPKNLTDLQQAVIAHQADIGLAFDGDGDRLGVIDNQGTIFWPDRLLILFAQSILQNNPDRTIIYDIKSTRALEQTIKAAGGVPLMWKTGHSLIKAKMQETNAILAGEMSGHIFFQERWFGFDDALYAGARLLELLSSVDQDAATLFANIPDAVNTPELNIPVTESEKFTIIEKMIKNTDFPNAENIVTLDGLRVEFSDSWGLIRPSNTTPMLIARFEAQSDSALGKITQLFRTALQNVAPHLTSHIPF